MKSFLKIIAWIIGVPVFIILIIGLLGYSAIRFDFWPPTCDILPVKEAKRVCEFSKLNKAPDGQTAVVTFWVTVPGDAKSQDKIFLALAGREPVAMEKVGATSWQKTVDVKTGDKLSYHYFKNTDAESSAEKSWEVKSLTKYVYDNVDGWNGVIMDKKMPMGMVGVQMKDTWTINYNMNLFEDTRRNLDASMARAAALGAKDFGVFSFIDMMGEKNNFTVVETASPYYHWRDAAITQNEMAKLVKIGKKYGLTITLHYNVGADYNKYYQISPFSKQAGSGVGGNAAEAKAGEDLGRSDPKTKEWLDRYFTQLKSILVEWARRAQATGITAIDITPQYRPPTVAPLDSYADEKYQDIIKAIRALYQGKIYASNFSKYGGFSTLEKIPQYLNDVDGLFVYSAPINVRAGATVAEMRAAHNVWLNEVEQFFRNYKKPVYLVVAQASYEGATSGKPAREWGDFAEALAAGYKQNWQEQADSYEALLEALNGRTGFAGVFTAGYWWDDLMAPKYVGTLNNMEDSIREKPAEAVWKKWFSVK